MIAKIGVLMIEIVDLKPFKSVMSISMHFWYAGLLVAVAV